MKYCSLLISMMILVCVVASDRGKCANEEETLSDPLVRLLHELTDREEGVNGRLSEESDRELVSKLREGLEADYSDKAVGVAREWQYACLLQVAGLTKDPRYRPLLSAIADHYKGHSPLITFYAMHSLWLSGENRGVFLNFVREWDETDGRSIAAGFVLSYQPDDEAKGALEHARDHSRVGSAFDAANAAMRMTSSFAEGLSLRRSIHDKVEHLLENMFRTLHGDDWADVVWLDRAVEFDWPLEIWARTELKRLAHEHPAEVYEALDRLVVPERLPESVQAKYEWFAEYVARFAPLNNRPR